MTSIQDKLTFELPKGFYNIAISISNHLIADTNHTANWDTISIPLPDGEWKIQKVDGKKVTLARENSPNDNPLKIPINHDMKNYFVTLKEENGNETRVIVEAPDRESMKHILANSSYLKNCWGRYKTYTFVDVPYINRYGGSGSVYPQELVNSYIRELKDKGEL